MNDENSYYNKQKQIDKVKSQIHYWSLTYRNAERTMRGAVEALNRLDKQLEELQGGVVVESLSD